jgi:hypothetical protein
MSKTNEDVNLKKLRVKELPLQQIWRNSDKPFSKY